MGKSECLQFQEPSLINLQPVRVYRYLVTVLPIVDIIEIFPLNLKYVLLYVPTHKALVKVSGRRDVMHFLCAILYS